MTIVCNLMTCLTHCKVTSHYVGRLWSVYCKHSYPPPTPHPPTPPMIRRKCCTVTRCNSSSCCWAMAQIFFRSKSDHRVEIHFSQSKTKWKRFLKMFFQSRVGRFLLLTGPFFLFISVAQISLDYLSLGSTPFLFGKQLKHIGSIWFLYTDRESKNSGEEERQHISMAAATFTLIWEPTLGSS